MSGRPMVDINHPADGTQGPGAFEAMSALSPTARPLGPEPGRLRPPRPPGHSGAQGHDGGEGRTHGRRRGLPRVGRRLATMGLLVALGVTLLAAVPSLRGVLREIGDIGPGWILVAVALELASAVSFVVVFRLFFDGLDARDARILAWTAQGSGALLPGGGAGGLAIGGWLAALTGAPGRWIVRRSAGLFFLSAAVSSAALIGAGLEPWPGPRG